MIIIIASLVYISSNDKLTDPLWSDVKNILGNTFVGLFFSFLISIKDIRGFLLKSASQFLTDDSYLDKLDKNELTELNIKTINKIHGIDLASDKESLFNHFKKLNVFLTLPYREMLNENHIYEYYGDGKKLFIVRRIQSFRVHALDLEKHNTYKIINGYSYKIESDDHLESIKGCCDICVKVEGKEIFNSKNDNSQRVSFLYNERKNEYVINFECDISLQYEYTNIIVESTRIQKRDDVIASFNISPTYGSNYNITLPNDLCFTNLLNNNTMDLGNHQTNHVILGSSLSLNSNGWHLPGLIFVATYTDKSNCGTDGGECLKVFDPEVGNDNKEPPSSDNIS